MNELTHELRTWPNAYALMVTGAKTLEYRRDDRGFQAGDLLRLREYDPDTDTYSGREMTVKVTDVQRGPDWGIPVGYAVMSVKTPTEAELGLALASESAAKIEIERAHNENLARIKGYAKLARAARQALDLLATGNVRKLLDEMCCCDPDVGHVCFGCATVTELFHALAAPDGGDGK